MPPFAQAGGIVISPEDLFLAVKLGPGRGVLHEILLRRLAASRAQSEGVVAGDEEVEEACSEFFAERDLMEPSQIDEWLRQVCLSGAVVRAYVREAVLARKLRGRLVSDETVEKRFRSAPHAYASAQVEIVEFESSGLAAEVMLQVKEGEMAWLEAVKRAGGVEPAALRRREAPEEIATLLFSLPPGSLLGPVETDQGAHAVYRLLSRSEPELDDELREAIRVELFEEELLRPLARQPLTFLT